ncbi:hypothetical protein B0T18DRAFT_81850 [Schizothecium vesticola]|uniref:Uncharacterized protein n=1 Tax=Schizothecium vesticola TaxID=314040 RepID=A0AA40F6D9_9PEZI|nr:hypothetical protein B0T18DRAFT_81850 [Schizothecium vesticola]
MARKRKRSRQECGRGKDGREDEKTRSQTMRWDDAMSEVEQWEMRLWGRFKGLGSTGGSLGKKTERGSGPLVLGPGRPGSTDHPSGTRRHLQFHRRESGGQDRGGAVARCQLLSFCHRLTVAQSPSLPRASNHFPYSCILARPDSKNPQLGDDLNLERQSNRRRYCRVSSPSGPWLQQMDLQMHRFATAVGYEQAILAGGLVAFLSPDIAQRPCILTDSDVPCFASAEKRSAHGETSAVCLFNLQRLPNLAYGAQTVLAESRASAASCLSASFGSPAVSPRVAPWKKNTLHGLTTAC